MSVVFKFIIEFGKLIKISHYLFLSPLGTYELSLLLFSQVHITQGDHNGRGMIISWVTSLNEDGSNVVTYWIASSDGSDNKSVIATTSSYRYFDYTSGYLHHAIIKELEVL